MQNMKIPASVIQVAGADVKILNNTIFDVQAAITFLSTTFTTDLLRTHEILISGNNINSRAGACLYMPIQGTAVNVKIVNNTFNCAYPIGWDGGIFHADTNTIVYSGN